MNRAGVYKTNLSNKLIYKSFLPNPLPPNSEIQYDEEISRLIVQSNRSVAKLDAISKRLPNIPLFVYMYVRMEALLSSQIEGTQATLDDILDPDIENNTNKNVADVLNYINAINHATNRLSTLPICNRLILETHKVLMKNVRGNEKNPGEFRKSQNWIGPKGSTLKNATYIPPSTDDMITAMSDLEKYINNNSSTDLLVKAALIHYQFETIHPFLDGNGRIGRLLINLFLKENKILSYPTLYISYFLKRNRVEYYDRLNEVREKGAHEQWIKFFLKGIYESAEDAIDSIDKLTELHDKNISIIKNDTTKFKSEMNVFEFLESFPIVDIKKTASTIGIAYNTVSSVFKKFIRLGIIRQIGNNSRGRHFVYEDYLRILRKETNDV